MASSIEQAKITGFAAILPETAPARLETYQEVYEQNCHRLYSLAFWMTDNEIAAEELMSNVFYRAFASSSQPTPEALDRALITEVRELMPLGALTLQCQTCEQVLGARRNVKRIHLERALVQLPATERLIFLLHDVESYDHARIARTLGLSEEESQYGLHQARLRVRNLVAASQD